MLRLTTLDGISLTRDSKPVQAVLNRRLSVALLLMLAARGQRGMTRDAIIEMLWPDNSLKDPKHSLDQLLTVTRTMSGESELFLGTSTLKLNPAAIETDVDEFESALRDQRWEQVASLYRSPFADGFSAGASVDLEQFLAATQARLAVAHSGALRTLAERAEQRADYSEAAGRWQTLLEANQLEVSVAVKLIAALAACDRTAEAMRTARGFAALLKRKRGQVNAEITRWLDRLERQIANPDLSPVRSDEKSSAAGATSAGGRPPRPGSGDRESRAKQLIDRVIAGRYRIERLLRSGSIENVYVALDTTGSKRHVELHLLEPIVSSTAALEHFNDVFRSVSLLSHPAIVPTFDSGEDGRIRFVVTALSGDATLDVHLKREGPMPIRSATAIASDIASAVGFAHERGVVHGDLRPRHVVLGSPNSVRAFGFAESIVHGTQHDESAVLTLGSTVYHSPEQLLGTARYDAASDVYALGCLLFEMLAGEPPFGGPTRPSRMLKLSQSAPSVRDFRETVSDALAEVIRKCVARVPADRYRTGSELLEAIRQAERMDA